MFDDLFFPISSLCSVKSTTFLLLGSFFPCSTQTPFFPPNNYLIGYNTRDYGSASLSQFIVMNSVEAYIQLYSSVSHFINDVEVIAFNLLI